MSMIPLDFELVAPFFRQKPVANFTLKGKNFQEILKQFLVDRHSNLLIYMRGPITAKQAAEFGRKISKKMSKDSLVVWSAEEWPRYEFEFFVYDSPNGNAFEKKNIRDYFRLTQKIIRLGVLSDRDSAHLATMFTDAASSCDPNSVDIDAMFDRLLDLSIRHSRKSSQKACKKD